MHKLRSAQQLAPIRIEDEIAKSNASHGTSSDFNPEIRLITPPGTSLVWKISPSVMPGKGFDSEVTATTVFLPTSAGAMRLTMPRSAGSSGATTPTTPVGSGTVKL